MAQRYVKRYVGTHITLPGSGDDSSDGTSKLIIRKTPSMSEISSLFSSTSSDSSSASQASKANNDRRGSSPTKWKIPKTVNSALRKLRLEEGEHLRHRSRKNRITTTTERIEPYLEATTNQKNHHRVYKLFKRSNITISVEGNIGMGKTSLLRKLETFNTKILAIPEPINQWCNYFSIKFQRFSGRL